MSGTIALRTTAPYPAFIAGQGLITVGMTDIPDLFPETQAIIAASPIPVSAIAAYWINIAIFEMKNRNMPYVQMAYFVALLQRYISNGFVLWSTLDVGPTTPDNTGPLTALPTGILVIGDTPGVISFSGPVTWNTQLWLLLDSSMQLVCTGTEPDTPVINASGNDIGIIGLNLTLPLPTQGLGVSNCIGLNIQTATFTRAADMTTYGILQTIVSDHVAIVSIPANMPDLPTVYDPTQTSGRFARRYLTDFTINQDPANTQAVWCAPAAVGHPSPPLNLGPRLWQIPVKHSISSKAWVVGDWLGLKSKHGGVTVLRIANCSNVLVGGVSMHESSRCVFTNIANLTLTDWRIQRPPDEVLTTNEGGAQCVGCTNVLVDTYTTQNTGDDALAFFSFQPPADPVSGIFPPPIPSTGLVKNVTINDSFARGILLWTTPNVVVDPSCVVVDCPILEHAAVNPATTLYLRQMTTQPDFDRQVLIDNFVVAIRSIANGGTSATDIFSKLDWLLLLKSHASQAALIDLISPTHDAVIAGGANWNIDQSFDGNGIDGSLRTNFFGTPNYTQNSACMFAYNINALINENLGMCGGRSAAPLIVAEIVPFNNGNMSTLANDATVNTDAVTTSPAGFYLWNRTDANTKSVYKDGVLLSTHTTASTAIPTAILALSNGGSFSTAQLALFGYGAALLPAEITTLNTAAMAFVTAF